jgi:hypothetical protein
MWEALIEGVRRFLDSAAALFGDGDLACPPARPPVCPTGLPPICGASATLDRANAFNAALGSRLDQLCERDEHIGSVISRVCDSVAFGRKVVAQESASFDSGLAALGPVANSPFGVLSLLPLAAGVVSAVTGGVTGQSGLMSDLSQDVYDADPRADDDESVYLASNSLQANPVGALTPFLQAVAGTPYEWGGFSRRGLDCSGAVSALVNYAVGRDAFADRTSTHSMASWLARLGGRPGRGRPQDITVGWTNAGVGHTAATVGGLNYECRGGDGVVLGADARAATDAMFTDVWHIPMRL